MTKRAILHFILFIDTLLRFWYYLASSTDCILFIVYRWLATTSHCKGHICMHYATTIVYGSLMWGASFGRDWLTPKSLSIILDSYSLPYFDMKRTAIYFPIIFQITRHRLRDGNRHQLSVTCLRGTPTFLALYHSVVFYWVRSILYNTPGRVSFFTASVEPYSACTLSARECCRWSECNNILCSCKADVWKPKYDSTIEVRVVLMLHSTLFWMYEQTESCT